MRTLAYVPSQPLSKREQEGYIRAGELSCKYLIQNALNLSRQPCVSTIQNKKTLREAKIHRGRDAVDPALTAVCAATSMTGTLEEIAEFFNLDSPKKDLAFAETMGYHTDTRQQLFPLTSPTEESPMEYSNIVWTVVNTPSLMAKRDSCVLEYHKVVQVKDSNKQIRRGWVRCLQSVEVLSCPSLKNSHGYIRSSIYRSGQLFVETDTPETLNVYNVVAADYGGYFPVMATFNLSKKFAGVILRMEEYFAGKILHKKIISRRRWLQKNPVNAGKTCSKCNSPFKWFLRKPHSCALCHELICHDCGNQWQLPQETVIVCIACYCPCDIEKASIRSMTLSSSDLQREKLKSSKTPDQCEYENYNFNDFLATPRP